MTTAHERIAESICQSVAEIPDRSSPDNCPEAMLVTADELHTIVVCALENEAERQSHSLPGDVERQGYVATVPPDCDRIVWRGNFYGLAALTPSPCPGDGMREALEPFACDDFETPITDEQGWTEFGLSWSKDRIRDWFGPSAFRRAREAYRAALTPSALSGDAGEGEPWPGCHADLQQRRVTTLAKLGLMLSVMASGEAFEVVGYDAAELYAEVLMALAIEDADDTDIALELARDNPDDDRLVNAGRSDPGVNCPDCGGRIATACPHCGAQPVDASIAALPSHQGAE